MLSKIIKPVIAMSVFLLGACAVQGIFTKQEGELIDNLTSASPMRVLTVENDEDTRLLRSVAQEVEVTAATASDKEVLKRLCGRMLATVRDPANDGVGIAAPQVGVSRRVVIVQRFDKEGEPFEAYINPVITATAGDKAKGPEGCLSIPGRSGVVARWRDITIRYNAADDLSPKEERIVGFTAVIFQHEIDHLDGILFTDRLEPEEAPGEERDSADK